MTPAERAQATMDAEAAAVFQAIQARMQSAPGEQFKEFGAAIYIDRDGTVKHTPLIDTPDQNARIDIGSLPTNEDGTPDYSTVIGFIHSHPNEIQQPGGGTQTYFGPDPSQWTVPADYMTAPHPGDWTVFNSWATNIAHDGGNAANFQMYIAGYNPYTGQLELNRYSASDNNGNTRASDGDPVSSNAQPPCGA